MDDEQHDQQLQPGGPGKYNRLVVHPFHKFCSHYRRLGRGDKRARSDILLNNKWLGAIPVGVGHLQFHKLAVSLRCDSL